MSTRTEEIAKQPPRIDAPLALTVTEAGPGDDANWDAFVDGHERGTIFHRTPWRQLIQGEMKFRPAYLMATVGEEIRGVLPLFEVPVPLRRRCMISVPFAVYGGPLAADDIARDALMAEARTRLTARGCEHLELRGREPTGLVDLPGTDLYVTYVRDLPDDPAECLGMLPRKARAAARQARNKFGLAGIDTRDLMDLFHPLFLLNKRRLGSPSFSAAFFRRAIELHGDQAGLYTIVQKGRPVSAVLYFTYRDTIFPYFSGTAEGAESMNASNFMYMALMEQAVRRGFKRFDFGRSRRGTGSARFKEHQGFEPTDLDYRYLLHRADAPPANNPSNPRYDRVKRIWSRTPLWVTQRLGPRLIRYFS